MKGPKEFWVKGVTAHEIEVVNSIHVIEKSAYDARLNVHQDLSVRYELTLAYYKKAVKTLKYIAGSTPGPEESFELENKTASINCLKELGEI